MSRTTDGFCRYQSEKDNNDTAYCLGAMTQPRRVKGELKDKPDGFFQISAEKRTGVATARRTLAVGLALRIRE